MNREVREVVADWLMVIGALALFISLFLAWSHQFSPAFRAQFGSADSLRGVPGDPTAWQVYSTVDVLLAVLAVAIVVTALVGNRAARFGTLVAAGIGLAFTLHALSVPPTNGANVFNPALNVPQYLPTGASAGVGETVAIAALALTVCGLMLSFTAD